MAAVQTAFRPQQHGFPFANYFELKFPNPIPLPLAGIVRLEEVTYGLCGGMCFAALDYYYAQQPVPAFSSPEELDRDLFAYLCDRQLDSLKIPVLLKVIQWMLFEKKEVAARMRRYELPKLRRRLDHGEPSVLVLVRAVGIGDLTQNHQVLATGYELDQDGCMRIRLYDPNYPAIEPSLSVRRTPQGLEVVQSTGEALRGFFVLDYRPQRILPLPAPAPEFGVLAAEGIPAFRLSWPVDSRRVNQYFGENPENYRPFKLAGHEGLDLYALSGANIYAAADGEVYEVGEPKKHPYGLHVRIQHEFEGKVYKTVYAHLSEAHVRVGQKVAAGERIGLADNSGNSFGSHLHLTLKIDGESTSGYPGGIVDPWPYLLEARPQTSGLVVYTAAQLNLHSGKGVETEAVALLPAGEALIVLGDTAKAKARIGKEGEWIQVQTAGGLAGYVAAAHVQTGLSLPPSDLVVYPITQVNLRAGPATTFPILATLAAVDPLTVLGSTQTATARLGRQGEWLQVQAGAGQKGFVAAWLVHTTAQPVRPSGLTVTPTDVLNLRARASVDSATLAVLQPGTPLAVLGDRDQSRLSIGQEGQWLNVRTPDKFLGYVAAWFVREV